MIPSNTWFLGLTEISLPNGISISSAAFAGHIRAVINTYVAACDICSNRPHLCNVLDAANNYRLRGSASPVLTATGFVNGKGQFSTPHRIDTPQPITKKFVTGDYVGDPYGCAQLGTYPYTGGFWAHG